ncbi:hypothetical protein [Sphingomonas sp. LaA6.9]|uniref:hypothetical protein n=1 Tax=Sphingomonas sp. LaA6.9 TaxID=2919914 RepID=UPI001F4F2232|nr:hypothetical protein [Sphingomonas sp. LaA6.9]MCJ8158577.1 hypothetical protein [Sphingomonas sp. LaA6.9]
MAQFLSTALFLATLAFAISVIAMMLRTHLDAIRHALAGHSLAATAAEQREIQARLNAIRIAPRQRDRNMAMPRRPAPLRAAA